MQGLLDMEGGETVLPFVRQFYGCVSQYLWEDDAGVTHTILQGEGGEQGDPLMPMFYSLGQNRALEAIHNSFQEHITAQLERSFQKQETFIQRIPFVPDLQATWLIRLHCASARANNLFRVVDPSQVYTQLHDERLWSCSCHFLGIAPDLCDAAARSTATLYQSGGVLGELG